MHAVMLAADAGYADVPLHELRDDFPTHQNNPPLGSWEHKPTANVHHDALIIRSGVWLSGERLRYEFGIFPDCTPRPKERTRGLGTKLIDAEDGYHRLREAFLRDGCAAVVHFGPDQVRPGQRVPKLFIGWRSALHRGQPELAGTWQPIVKDVTFDPMPKREVWKREGDCFLTVPAVHGDPARTLPGYAPMLEMSHPYLRLDDDYTKMLSEDQPDHGSILGMLTEPVE